MGCAWEPPLDGVPAAPWQHTGYTGPEPTTCPGYTIKLPEVAETVEASFFLERGALALLVKDELADGLRDSLGVLAGAYADVTSWIANQQDK